MVTHRWEADLLRELADDPKEEEYAAEGHEFLERERRGCDERGGGEQMSLVRKSTFLGMTDRARYARRGTKERVRGMARRTVCSIPTATSGEQHSPEDHPRARPSTRSTPRVARAGTRNIVVNNFLRACERLVETSAARSGSERSTRRSSHEKV